MLSHYHRLAAIYLVSLLILRVSPSPALSVSNVNLSGVGSSHHTVTGNADCNKTVGNPFDILPSFLTQISDNNNPNAVPTKPLELFGDEDSQIGSEIKDTYDIGAYSAVCWSRIVTTVEDKNGRLINNFTEYAISFETPGDIPDKYLAQYSIEEHNNKYVKKSVQVPIVNVRKSGANTVREKSYVTCSSGPFYSRTLIKYKNNKKKLEIRVSPESRKNDLRLTENKSVIDEICEDPEDDEKTTAIKEELLWQIIRDILGKNGQDDVSGNNLTDLINAKRAELIEKIEDIMPDNTKKTDNILDETIQKIKQDEFQSTISEQLPGGSKISSSQWGTSTNSESTELKSADTSLVNDSPEHLSYKIFRIKVTEFVSHRRGVILDEIMRHMKVTCYDISAKILETDCPAQLDVVPTMDSTKLPSFVSYTYTRDVPESIKQNSFLVTDPLRKACYHLVKVRTVECPQDASNLLDLRIVTYVGNSQSNNLNRPSAHSEVPSGVGEEKLKPEWHLTKYVDSNNIVYCFKENANSLQQTTCPKDTTSLQFVPLTHGQFFLARYIDNEGWTACVQVYEHLLKPTKCESDAMNLPIVQPTNERPLPVKFLDEQKNVHCYLQYPNRMEHTSCSNEYSILPEVSMKNQIYLAQYVDFYKNRFCFEVHNDFIKKVTCPSEALPFLHLTSEQSFMGKVEIGNGIEFCYIVYTNYWKPTSCPDDTSNIPVSFSSTSDLYIGKVTDNANEDFCYFVYKNSLKPAPCPLDTSNLPSVDLVNNKSYIGRTVDANNKEHCFTVSKDSMEPVACPRDTARLPFIISTISGTSNSEYIHSNSDATHSKNGAKYIAENSQATIVDKSTNNLAFGAEVGRTFRVKVTEFISHRRGVILDEIMRHMKVTCYDISAKILKTDCPAQLDVVPTMDSTKLPSFVSYTYTHDVPESVKQHSFLVTDPSRKACYHLVKVRTVECPQDTSNLLDLRTVTYSKNGAQYIVGSSQAFTIKVTEFVSHRRDVILNEIMRHMKVTCYDISAKILKTDCPAQLDVVPTMDSTKLPSFVSYTYTRDIPESIKQNSFLVTDPLRKACYHLVKVRTVECPQDTSNLLDLRTVTYVGNSQATTTDKSTNNLVIAAQVGRTFTIKVTEFVSHRRGVILNEIMRHMKVTCYDISEKILKTDCPAQLDVVPTMDSTKLPSFVSYTYTRDIPESIKQNSFLVTDPSRKACYHLVKVRTVECPQETSNLLDLRIVTYVGNSQATTTDKSTNNLVIAAQVGRTFTIKVTEFVSHRRDVILDEIMHHMKVTCYDISAKILETDCPAQLDVVPTMESAKLPSFVSYTYTRDVPESIKQNSFLVTDPSRKACYHLVKVRTVECPQDTSNLLDLRTVSFARYSQATTTAYPTYMTVFPTKVERTYSGVVEDINKEKLRPEWHLTKYVDSNNIVYCFKENANSLQQTTCPKDTTSLQFVPLTHGQFFLARYIDIEGWTACVQVYEHLLKPTKCPSDVINLPVVQPTNERPLPVKFLDEQKNVHCYLQYPNRMEHTSCSNEYSILPEVSMKNQIYLAQYVDFYKNRFCFEVHNDFIKKVTCPSETLPFLHLTSEQLFMGKVEIGNGIEFCYIVYTNYWKPTSCPDNTSNIPVIFSSTSVLYIGKVTDNANEDFCYFVYKNSLKPAQCPLDTSNLPAVDLVNGKSYIGRTVDANNKEHCFTVSKDSMEPVACPRDTARLPFINISLGPSISMTSETSNSEYIGKMKTPENGMQCFMVSNNIMNAVTCPKDLSTIPDVRTTDQIGYLAKYVDFMGQIKCVTVYKNAIQKSICPTDTSKLPLAPMAHIVDKQVKKDHTERKIEQKAIKVELAKEIIKDIGNGVGDLPMKQELLEEVVEDLKKERLEPEWYFTKYVDSNNVVYCFKENANSLNITTCPEDTANLQFVSLTPGRSFLARYIDIEGWTACVQVYEHLLKPIKCASDAMNLPLVQPTNERPLPVKFLDEQKNVHCYLQYPNRMEHTSCSNEYSILPQVSMKNKIYLAQYVDFYKNRFCFEVHNDFIKKVTCPSETLPFLHLTSEQSFMGKVEIGNGIEFCYIVYTNYWKPTSCPDDTSNIPVSFSSTSDLYIGKVTDNANEDFCYFVYKNSLKPAPCPLDTSNLPAVDLVNGKFYIGRTVDANNKEHCFTVSKDSMEPVACPKDTARLPFILSTLSGTSNSEYIGKMKTPENGMQCFTVSNNIMNAVTCPEDLSTIPDVRTTDQIGYLAKYVDFMGQIKCVTVYKNAIQKSICPTDTSKLPLAPMPHIVDKQVKKDHTERKIEQKAIKVELAKEIIKDIGNGVGDLPVKQELLEEIVEDLKKERLEPEWYFTKYVDSNNVVYCFKENANSLNITTCPEDTANLQFVSLTEGRSFLARYIDYEGRTHCVHVYNHLLKPATCLSDVMNLPVVQPTNDRARIVKFLGKQNNVQCYLQYPNRLEQTSCSNDDSTSHQTDEMGYLAKYVDALGQMKCFIVYKNSMQNTVCPVDTSLLPLAPMSANAEWYGKYVTPQGVTVCLKIQGNTRTAVRCPVDAHMLPTVKTELPNSVTLRRKEIRELIKVMCNGKFYSHFQKNNNSIALQKLRQFLP